MRKTGHPELPPLAERVAVDRIGDALVLRPRENNLVILAADDLLELQRVLGEPRGGEE